MPTGPIKLVSTLYLILFLIGGGRVCGCESLSWVGIDVHHCNVTHAEESPCCHHHHGEHDHEEGNSDQPHSDEEPMGGGPCCEESLQLYDGEIPKKLPVPDDAPFSGELALVPFAGIDSFAQNLKTSPVWSKRPLAICCSAKQKLLFEQRSNV
ncbi:MAG: hypothetical protein P1V20_06885 [Verrucomicrobiales bacterium]|nr:hypothetical protein [Verrucomicrobiales bacterium]